MPSGWPSAIAPPLTFTFSESRPSSRITARLCDAKASFSSTRSISSSGTPLRSSSLRTAGIGPMPITRGSTPATALPTNVPSGSTPSSPAFSSDAITSAAAPSSIPDALPAVTVPPSRNAGFSPPPLRLERERVLVLPRHAPTLGDVLPRLAHRLGREELDELRIREAPAERRVVDRAVAALERLLGLRRHERCAAHRLLAARDEEIAVTRDHGMAGADDGREPGGAQTVDGHARRGFRE